ncbi:MAG: hypothetical protein LWX56_02460 [Ignavibacteria bacterium]|nr:hypothetical protein [Ignavibacteria bacterium]
MINRNLLFIIAIICSLIVISGCEAMQDPNDYLEMPGEIQVGYCTRLNSGKYEISLSWTMPAGGYSFNVVRSGNSYTSNTISNLYYVDSGLSQGTYEYKIYALKNTDRSLPAYIKIKINYSTYEITR